MKCFQIVFSLLIAGQLFVGAAAAPAAEGDPAPQRQRPNVLVIVADDLGYGELGCQGNPQIPTPHIDSMANSGIRFTSGYVSCPVCSPTRAGLMTGRYQQRFGHEFNPGNAAEAGGVGLPLTEKTMADRLKIAGYATGMFGKWHLGYKPPLHPLERGFDEFFGFLGGAHDYREAGGAAKGDRGNPILRGRTPVKNISYTTDEFGREAAAFIDKHRGQPWFVYLAFNAVHTPLQAPQRYRDRFPAIKREKRHKFAGMLAAMDDAVGVVLATIRKHQLEENTLIFFHSDNGGPTGTTTSKNDPLNGAKGHVLEGGIRVPFLVQWKGRIPAGKVEDRPVIAIDILPTALAAAGQPAVDGLDGVNLLPYLTGEKSEAPHDHLYWRYGPKRAVRMGDWKLTDEGGGAMLFNLAKDVGEKHDLSKQEPEKLKQLEAAYARWNTQNVPARWLNRGRSAPQSPEKNPQPEMSDDEMDEQ
jgi:arylsulfatase A-like enzyme